MPRKTKGFIHILIGLPGSGKTFFSKELAMKSMAKTEIIDCDKMRNIAYRRNYLDEVFSEVSICASYKMKRDAIIDGLFLTNKERIELVNKLSFFKKDYDFILHVWNEDRETCMKNDAGRRKLDNKMTIKTIPYEAVDLELIKNTTGVTNITTQEHRVILKPDWKLFIDNSKYANLVKNDRLYSCEWSLGGGCEEFGFLSAEPQPLDFEEFDDLIEKICPEISYLRYKKIYRACVTVETRDTHEYYVGPVSYACYVCDMEKLYTMLKSFGYDLTLKEGDA